MQNVNATVSRFKKWLARFNQGYGLGSILTRCGGEACQSDPAKITRRQVLVAGTGAAVLGAKCGCGTSAIAQAGAGEEAVTVDAGLAANRSFSAFMGVSRRLTGRQSLNLKVALRIFEALIAQEPGLAASIEALESFWQKRDGVLPADLPGTLGREAPKLAGLPIALISAWYLGHAGAAGTVIAYEDALMFAQVADVLTPPSFCNGVPGYWAAEPGSI